MRGAIPSLASLCEGGGPAGPEGENLATTQNLSGNRQVLSPTRCGGSPLPEGAKRFSPIKQVGQSPGRRPFSSKR